MLALSLSAAPSRADERPSTDLVLWALHERLRSRWFLPAPRAIDRLPTREELAFRPELVHEQPGMAVIA